MWGGQEPAGHVAWQATEAGQGGRHCCTGLSTPTSLPPLRCAPHPSRHTLCPPARAACRFAALTELKPLVFATLMGHHRAGRHDLVQTYVWHLICAP